MILKNDTGKIQTVLRADKNGGSLNIYNTAGEQQATLRAGEPGGGLFIINKTGEEVVHILVDDNGNGVVGAYNRYGKGKTLQPGN